MQLGLLHSLSEALRILRVPQLHPAQLLSLFYQRGTFGHLSPCLHRVDQCELRTPDVECEPGTQDSEHELETSNLACELGALIRVLQVGSHGFGMNPDLHNDLHGGVLNQQ